MPIETPRPDPELGLLYLAGALEDAGFHADILDATVGTRDDRLSDTFRKPVMQDNRLIRIGMTETRISEVIAQGGYGVVGINSNFTPQTNMALEVAYAAKAVSRDIFVVVGGVNARAALAERFLQSGAVDAICLTEGERIAVNLMRTLAKGQDLAKVSGIARLLDGKVVRQPVAPTDVCQNLDELPFPRWEKLPFFHYDELAPRAVLALGSDRFGSLMTSRGCGEKCLYCHISFEKEHASETGNIGGLRFKSIDRVIEEARRLQALGVKKLYFEDDTLLAKKRRISEIFTRIRGMGFQIADVNGVQLKHFLKREGCRLVIDREFLVLLKEAGFNQIVFPVESASQRIIKKYATNKLNHDALDVVELVRIATEVGITCPINMMMGFPDETEEEMRSSIELGKRLVEAGSAYCTPFIPIPFPGCMLYDYAVANGHLAAGFDPDIFNWKNAVMKNTVVPPERVLELRDFAHEYMNTPEHVRARKEASAGTYWEKLGAKVQEEIGTRWQSGAPAVAS